jgi:hypothetical protein
MTRIKVIDTLETDSGEFVELTHNSAERARVYRIQIRIQSNCWSEWFTSTDSAFNERLARERFAEVKDNIQRKVMA